MPRETIRRIPGSSSLPQACRGGVVAIGNFDGVHRGHQAVLERALAQARRGEVPALVLTFEGVALSVPAIWFFAVFRNRIAAISSTVMIEADEFLRRFFHTARQKQPPGAAAAAPAKPS